MWKPREPGSQSLCSSPNSVLPLTMWLIALRTQSLFSSQHFLPPPPPAPVKGLLDPVTGVPVGGLERKVPSSKKTSSSPLPSLPGTKEQSARRTLCPLPGGGLLGPHSQMGCPGDGGVHQEGDRGVPACQSCLFSSQPELGFDRLRPTNTRTRTEKVYLSQAGRPLLLTAAQYGSPRILQVTLLRGDSITAPHTEGSGAARRGANLKRGPGRHR